MIANTNMDAHVHFRHTEEEVKALTTAVIPMMEFIARSSRSDERQALRRVTGLQYFRLYEAKRTYLMLLRAVRFTKASLGEYFPTMRAEILINAQNLENETQAYWKRFEELVQETAPTH